MKKVQAQNLTDYTIEENKIAELDILRTSYNKMLLRLSESFETQRQFTGNAAHELRTPLALIRSTTGPLSCVRKSGEWGSGARDDPDGDRAERASQQVGQNTSGYE